MTVTSGPRRHITDYSHWSRVQDSRDHRLERGRGVSLVVWSLKLGRVERSFSMDLPGKPVYIRTIEWGTRSWADGDIHQYRRSFS